MISVVAVRTVKRTLPSKKKFAAVINGDIKTAKETSQKQNAKLKYVALAKVTIHVRTVIVLHRAIPPNIFTKRKKYKEAGEFIQSNDYAKFVKIADKWTMQYGRFNEKK